MNKVVYLISNIEEYGKLMAYCIENNICVFRSFWDEREKGIRCYHIDFEEKRCLYSDINYYLELGYSVVVPVFTIDKWGCYHIDKENTV